MKLHLPSAAACLLVCAGCADRAAAPVSPPVPPTPLTLDSGGERVPEQLAVAFERADLGIKVLPESQTIEGDATLAFRALSRLERLVVDLDRNLAVSAIEVDGTPLPATSWSNPDGRLGIELPRPLAEGETVEVRIAYAGKPRVAERAPWDGGFVWSTAPGGEPWIATAVQGEGCDLFWPCIDHPQGEPRVVEQRVTVPVPLVAVGNGVALGMEEHDGWRTYRWRANSPNTYAIALNIGPYEEIRDEYPSRYGNRIPLHFWHLAGRGDKARGLFAEFAPMLDFFERTIGPYPFADEKMGVVETPHLGMEHQTVNAYGNDYRKDVHGYDWLLQHELAHEWFGNQMTNLDWDDMWLHEGFGSYMQPLYLQYLRGDMEYQSALMDQRALVANRHPVVSGKPRTAGEVYDDDIGPGQDIYQKASLVLHTLRGLIGDEAFFASVRRLVYGTDTPAPGNFQPRHASTRDFIDIVNDVTGRDYGWFFDVYLYRADLPELVAVREGDTLKLQWKVPDELPFPMPVEVRVGGVDGEVRVVSMATGSDSIALPMDAAWTLDPHSKLLRELPHLVEFHEDRKARAQASQANTGG